MSKRHAVPRVALVLTKTSLALRLTPEVLPTCINVLLLVTVLIGAKKLPTGRLLKGPPAKLTFTAPVSVPKDVILG